ncbi:MAG: UspA domain protein [Solirubrobacterales bacterium]|nr:UspA domain protein [Solirubrobacterales bacterium]
MPAKILVSYDDTANDRDAATLGRLLGTAGATVELAYVRHDRGADPSREVLREEEAHELLARGAQALGAQDARRHVILHASTGAGLRELAEREGVDVVVFGSDYRTAAGSVKPGVSVQRLLSGGPSAVAIATAHLRERPQYEQRRIGVLSEGPDLAAAETAQSLADAIGADVVDTRSGDLDLLVIGSRPEAELGRVMLSAVAEYAIDLSRCPVLVVPRGTAVRFGTPVLVA